MPPKRYFEQVDVGLKEADPKDAKPSSTLFVSSLPYSATTTDLQTLFSDIGPLKRAFVVTDQETKKSKGVGYVTFALAQDAKTALEQLQGKSLDGGSRKIQIIAADHREPIKARKTTGAESLDRSAAKKPKVHATDISARPTRSRPQHTDKDADAVRTVVLSGLAGCSPLPDSKQIYKRTRKIGDVENVVYPSPSSSRPEDVAHVVFRTPNHAMTAVEKLHAHIFKGVQISAILKKRADNAARIAAHMRPETLAKREQMRQDIEKHSGGGTMPVLLSDVDKSSRLIVRNLPYDVSEADLRSIFLPHGPIYEITIPKTKVKVEDASVTVGLESLSPNSHKEAARKDEDGDDDEEEDVEGEENTDVEKDAEDVDEEEEVEVDEDSDDAADIESGSEASSDVESPEEQVAGSFGDAAGVEVKHPNAKIADPASSSAITSNAIRGKAGEKGRGFAFVWMVSKNDAARAIEAINGKAIQHGLAERAAYKSAKGSKGRRFAKANLDRVRDHAQPERVVAVDWSLSKKDWEAKGEQSDVEGETNDDHVQSEDEDEDDEKLAEKPKLPEPEEGTTLFIRNLPYQATEEELRNLFRQFGPLRYARITMDRLTNRSKGTGFVCFWQVQSAESALQQARIIEKESGVSGASSSSSVVNIKNPFAMSSVLTADPAAPLTASLNLHGRVLNVIPAVARGEATKLETSGRKEREKGDKRNTWLLREGVPFPSSDFAARLAPSEVEKRLQSFQVRKAQMGVNPSLFISKTRLSVRSLPLFVSERMLKRLAIHSIKAFGLEVRAGSREDLDTDEKADRTISASIENRKRKLGERPTSVIQTKVVRQNDRIEALTGVGKSKGYGFLEMKSFVEALKVVRWANGNKEVAKLFGEWWQDDLQTQIDRVATQIQAKTKNMEGKKADDADAAKADIEDLDLRKKRLKMKLKELQDGSLGGDKVERGGMLMIEFAIENVVTTKKRADKIKAIKDSAVRRQEREEQDAEAEKITIEQQRIEAQAAQKIENDLNKPRGNAHGHVIGKKRKERKARRN